MILLVSGRHSAGPSMTPVLEYQSMNAVVSSDRTAGRKLGDVRAVADKLDCSPRHIYRMADAGRMPAPLRLASLVRWDLEEIDRWIADGCKPVRATKRGRSDA